MVEHDYDAESGKGEEDEAEDGVDEAEEGRAEAGGHEANEEGQRGEPGHQAGSAAIRIPHSRAFEPKMIGRRAANWSCR